MPADAKTAQKKQHSVRDPPAVPGQRHPARHAGGDHARMKKAEMAAIADMISEVLLDIKNVEAAHKVRTRVRELTAKFPLPY